MKHSTQTVLAWCIVAAFGLTACALLCAFMISNIGWLGAAAVLGVSVSVVALMWAVGHLTGPVYPVHYTIDTTSQKEFAERARAYLKARQDGCEPPR